MKQIKTYNDANQVIYHLDALPKLMSFQYVTDYSSYPYWLLVRFSLLEILIDVLGFGSPQAKTKVVSIKQLPFWFGNIFKYRTKKRRQNTDVLFVTPAGGSAVENNKSYNLYHDDYCQYLNETLSLNAIIIETAGFNLFYPRKNIGYARSLSWDMLICKLKQKLFAKRQSEIDSQFIQLIEGELSKVLSPINTEKVRAKLEAMLQYMIRNIHAKESMWSNLFKKYRPRYIVSQDLTYCGSNMPLTVVAKKMGITVVEDQHGCFDVDHVAYHYPNLNNGKYQQYFPDYLWVYGDYWYDSCQSYSPKIVMGNPYFSSHVEKTKDVKQDYDCLVISDALRPSLTEQIVKDMASQFTNILFRPHPRELSELNERYAKLIQLPNLDVSRQQNVYDEIAKVKYVFIIGVYFSTVGYEALALGKEVYVVANGKQEIICYPDQYAMTHIISIDDIKQKIIKQSVLNKDFSSQFYALNWQHNLSSFFKDQGLVSGSNH